MIKFRFDVASALESAGITSYVARKKKLFSYETWLKIKVQDANISIKSLNKICTILNMKPGHLIIYIPDKEDEEIMKSLIE